MVPSGLSKLFGVFLFIVSTKVWAHIFGSKEDNEFSVEFSFVDASIAFLNFIYLLGLFFFYVLIKFFINREPPSWET